MEFSLTLNFPDQTGAISHWIEKVAKFNIIIINLLEIISLLAICNIISKN